MRPLRDHPANPSHLKPENEAAPAKFSIPMVRNCAASRLHPRE